MVKVSTVVTRLRKNTSVKRPRVVGPLQEVRIREYTNLTQVDLLGAMRGVVFWELDLLELEKFLEIRTDSSDWKERKSPESCSDTSVWKLNRVNFKSGDQRNIGYWNFFNNKTSNGPKKNSPSSLYKNVIGFVDTFEMNDKVFS